MRLKATYNNGNKYERMMEKKTGTKKGPRNPTGQHLTGRKIVEFMYVSSRRYLALMTTNTHLKTCRAGGGQLTVVRQTKI
jgi:hypothetical protein